ncbi:MAG: pseudouridine synthase [Candidatus Orphnella occulta]|nr:pseudouridine synthase [Candidatus Orphnella occulta]
MSPIIRINKLLSQLGIASRRKADDLIKQGKVAMNGSCLSTPGVSVDTEKDKIEIDGVAISLKRDKARLYLLLNKPCGYITTLRDTHNRRTVMDLVPQDKGLFPVGRLDKDTTGLLMLTNDGELAHRMMHPRYEMEKLYEVTVAGALKRGDIPKLESGVDIGDEKPSICKVRDLKSLTSSTNITIELHEGRKRQIRRTFDALGYKILSLKRTVYAGLTLDTKEGSYRELTRDEVLLLSAKVGLK